MKIKNGEKKTKVTRVSARLVRQIELLSKYYDIDIEKRIIYIELHYQNVSDVLANDVSFKDAPQFSNDLLERVLKLVDSFPAEFDVDLKLKFDNYEGYNPELLMSSFKDNLEMFHYSFYKERKMVWLLSAILVIISFSLLALRLFAVNAKLFPDGGIVQEMVDICGWVFLWEGVSLLFLTESEKRDITKKVIAHLVSLSFLDSTGNVIVHVNHENLISSWIFETKKQKTGRILLLIGGAGCFAIGTTKFFDALSYLYNALTDTSGQAYFSFIMMGVYFAFAIIFILAGIGALNMFREKGPLQKYVAVIAWIMFVLDMLFIGSITALFIIYSGNTFATIFAAYLSIFIAVAIDVCYFIGYRMTKKNTSIVEFKE